MHIADPDHLAAFPCWELAGEEADESLDVVTNKLATTLPTKRYTNATSMTTILRRIGGHGPMTPAPVPRLPVREGMTNVRDLLATGGDSVLLGR